MMRLLCVAAVLLLALFVPACTSRPRIVVGCKNFTEQIILGELIAQQIESRTALSVERRFYLGGTYIAHQGILAGRIDIYPEYTGTALTAVLKEPASSDRKQVYDRVKSEYEQRFRLTLGPPLGFNDTFAIEIRGEDARRLKLETLSQAAQFTPQWRAGFGYARDDGAPRATAAPRHRLRHYECDLWRRLVRRQRPAGVVVRPLDLRRRSRLDIAAGRSVADLRLARRARGTAAKPVGLNEKPMFRKILVANDGSPGGQAALSGAIDLALQCGSELHMIRIEEIPRFAATIDEIEEEKEEADLRFTSVIRRAKELAAQKGVSLETHLLAGHPVPSIVEFLRAGTFDLLVGGFMGHSAIYNRLIGSTTNRLVDHAPCAVLVIK